jgi:hypothetical protein
MELGGMPGTTLLGISNDAREVEHVAWDTSKWVGPLVAQSLPLRLNSNCVWIEHAAILRKSPKRAVVVSEIGGTMLTKGKRLNTGLCKEFPLSLKFIDQVSHHYSMPGVERQPDSGCFLQENQNPEPHQLFVTIIRKIIFVLIVTKINVIGRVSEKYIKFFVFEARKQRILTLHVV